MVPKQKYASYGINSKPQQQNKLKIQSNLAVHQKFKKLVVHNIRVPEILRILNPQ